MRSVILFRHGKSDWYAEYEKDFDRPLAKRGILESKKMGIYLAGKIKTPDLVISSPATRTYSTAKVAIDSGKWNSKLILSRSLYESSQAIIVSLLSKQKNKYRSICIVGHEPSMSSFINYQTDQTVVKYPTATITLINYDIDIWSKIVGRRGVLKWIKQPKKVV